MIAGSIMLISIAIVSKKTIDYLVIEILIPSDKNWKSWWYSGRILWLF